MESIVVYSTDCPVVETASPSIADGGLPKDKGLYSPLSDSNASFFGLPVRHVLLLVDVDSYQNHIIVR
jgi:hypothetical protein